MTTKPHRRKTCEANLWQVFKIFEKFVNSEHGCDADWYSVLNPKPMANCSN